MKQFTIFGQLSAMLLQASLPGKLLHGKTWVALLPGIKIFDAFASEDKEAEIALIASYAIACSTTSPALQ
jgi:hypothetical protein